MFSDGFLRGIALRFCAFFRAETATKMHNKNGA